MIFICAECIKHTPTLWKNQETRSTARFHPFPARNSRELTRICSAGTLRALSQEDNIISICCSTGESLLKFLKVTFTAITYLRYLRDLRYGHRLMFLSRSGRQSCDARLRGSRFSDKQQMALPLVCITLQQHIMMQMP